MVMEIDRASERRVFLLAPPPGQGRAVYAHARPDAAAWLLAAPSGGMQESDRGGAAGEPRECVAGEERERREWAGLDLGARAEHLGLREPC